MGYQYLLVAKKASTLEYLIKKSVVSCVSLSHLRFPTTNSSLSLPIFQALNLSILELEAHRTLCHGFQRFVLDLIGPLQIYGYVSEL